MCNRTGIPKACWDSFTAFIHSSVNALSWAGSWGFTIVFYLYFDILTCKISVRKYNWAGSVILSMWASRNGLETERLFVHTCFKKPALKSLDCVYLSVLRLITNARSRTHYWDLYQMTDCPLLSERRRTPWSSRRRFLVKSHLIWVSANKKQGMGYARFWLFISGWSKLEIRI